MHSILFLSNMHSICISITAILSKQSELCSHMNAKYESRWGFWLTRFTWFRSTLSHMKSNITYSMVIKIIKTWGSYQNYIKWIFVIKIPKKKAFYWDGCLLSCLVFLKAVTTLQNGRWSVGHSSQVDRKTWISLERGYNKHLCKPSVWNRIKTKLDPNPVLQVSFLVLSLVANRERQNMNM